MEIIINQNSYLGETLINQKELTNESSVTSGSIELYGERTFQLVKKFSVSPELGYKIVGYEYRLTNNNQTIDFDNPFSMNGGELQNTAHRIVPRLFILVFKDLQIIASYHYNFF